jgi:prophage DNA circulation protein
MSSLEQLQELEDAKRDALPGSATFRHLAEQVERLAGSVFQLTVAQRDLAVEAEQQGDTLAPIAETMRPTFEVLADWRAAERRLSATMPDSAEHRAAQLDVDRFRDEYQRVFEAAKRAHTDDVP